MWPRGVNPRALCMLGKHSITIFPNTFMVLGIGNVAGDKRDKVTDLRKLLL